MGIVIHYKLFFWDRINHHNYNCMLAIILSQQSDRAKPCRLQMKNSTTISVYPRYRIYHMQLHAYCFEFSYIIILLGVYSSVGVAACGSDKQSHMHGNGNTILLLKHFVHSTRRLALYYYNIILWILN